MQQFFYKSLFIVLIVVLGFSSSSKATHIMGSDITWECLGNDKFEVTLSVYRDCTGIDLYSPSLNLGCKAGGSSAGITKNKQGGTSVKDVTPVCESSCTQCESSGCSFNYGIEKYTVTYIVDVSNTNCCKVSFSYSGCCRSNSITTGPSGSFYVESWMNICATDCNSSPEFEELPIGLLCKDQKFIYNQGATDDDVGKNGNLLDSLSYSFANPTTNPGSNVSYNSPYSYKEPLAYRTGNPNTNTGSPNLPFPFGFHLDENTGDLKFTPTKKQVSVMAFKIDEWRDTSGNGSKDTRVSQIRRDLQFFVIKCPNNDAPTITGMKCPKTDFYEEICAGTSSSFTFCTNDKNSKDSVELDFNQGNIPGSPSFTIQNPTAKHPTGKLKWTPADRHASQTPYQFTVSATDDNCPVNARTVESYRIKVKPIPKASYSVKNKLCGKFKFSAQKIEGKNMSYTWQGEGGIYSSLKNFQHQFTEPGKYPYKLTVSAQGCENVYRDTIQLDPFLRVDIGNDTTVCKGESIKLGGKAKDNNGPVTYTWHDGVTSTKNRTFKNLTNDTTITLTVKDTVCSYTDTVKVDIREDPQIDLGTDPRICASDTFTLAPMLKINKDSSAKTPWVYFDKGLQEGNFKWFKGQVSTTPRSTADSIDITQQGDYILQATDTFSCSNTDTINIQTNPKLNPVAKPKSVCRSRVSTLDAQKTGGPNVTYEWTNLRTNDSFSGKKVDVRPDSTSTYALVVEETTDSVFCRDSTTIEVKVKDLPDISLSTIPDICSNAPEEDLKPYASPNAGKWWAFNTNDNPMRNNQFFVPERVDPGVYDLAYKYTDPSTQCTDTVTTSVRILDLPNVDAGKDQIICTHEDNHKLNPSPVAASSSNWTGSGINQINGTEWEFDPTANSVNEGTQILVYSYTEPAPDQCTNKDTVKMTVQQSPNPNIPNQEICIDNEEEDLIAEVSDKVNWMGNNVRDSQFFETPSNPGNYDAVYSKSNNIYRTCTIYDTINYKVDDTPAVTASTRSSNFRFCENKKTVELYGTQNIGGANAGTWTMISDGSITNNEFSPEQNGPGEYIMAYQYTDPRTQCNNQDRMTITVDTLPEVNLETNSNVKCIGKPYTLEATFENANQITWTANGRPDGQGFSNINTSIESGTTTAKYEPNKAQKDAEKFLITIKADNPGICKPERDSIWVDLKPNPRPDFAGPGSGCPPFEAQFENRSQISQSGEIASYKWKFGDGGQSNARSPVHNYEKPGKYSVQLITESEGGCENQITKENFIHVYQPPEPDFTADPTYTSVTASVVDFTNKSKFVDAQTEYIWLMNDPGYSNRGITNEENPTHEFSDTGLYTVSLIAKGKNNCKDTMTKENYIEIEPTIIVYAPNAFSPDGDGKNDKFHVVADNFTSFEVSIFNRWGERLYYADDYADHRETGWDATYKGEQVPSGAYMYVVKTVGLNGETHTHSGTVNVLR